MALAAAGAAWAQNTLRAAAVVNDEIVSMLDVEQRMSLSMLSSGLEDSPALRRRMLSQVIRGLIDERLQAQEAKRLDIAITDEQVDKATREIAAKNNMAYDRFVEMLDSRGVLLDTLKDQVRAQLTWQTLVNRRIMPTAQVSEEEVEDVVARVRASEGTTLRLISEIFMAIDKPGQEAEVRGTAEGIFEQLRGKADFGALARQFSQSATAQRSGDIGWVQTGQLPEEVDAALESMQVGQVSRPIRSLSGYHIIWLRDQRQNTTGDIKIDLKQLLFALPPNPSATLREETIARAKQARANITGCEGFDDLAKSIGSPGSGDLGQMNISDLPPAVRKAVGGLSAGQASEPVALPAGVSVLVVCDRESDNLDRERIRQRLLDERLNVQARRLMRDLRRDANVDIRI